MKIYVASLADYNAGRLHGCWIDLEGADAETIQEQIDAMLKQSREPIAEEWRIDDYEGVPQSVVDTWSVAKVAEWAEEAENMDEDTREAFAWYLDHESPRQFEVRDERERFDEVYKGRHDSLKDYVIDDFYELNEVPAHLAAYICAESIMENWGANFSSETASGGGVHVFGPY